MPIAEDARVAELTAAQDKAARLFAEIETRGLARAGITESQLNEEIYALADAMFATKTHWHKRIVRAGKNTLLPYDENPPDLTLRDDEILFLDFGPVFEAWEADFGRTFVIGNDPLKLKLRDDVSRAFAEGKKYFHATPDITCSGLFRYAVELAGKFGWEFGGPIAGHLIGHFPHERIPNDKISLYVHPKNELPMRTLNAHGEQRHWILEMHFVDREKEIGGFFEELLTI